MKKEPRYKIGDVVWFYDDTLQITLKSKVICGICHEINNNFSYLFLIGDEKEKEIGWKIENTRARKLVHLDCSHSCNELLITVGHYYWWIDEGFVFHPTPRDEVANQIKNEIYGI